MSASVLPLFPKLSRAETSLALRVAERSLSYGQLSQAVDAFRARLAQLGVQPGQRIFVWAHPDLESIVGMVSAMLSGAVLIPLNPGTGDKELAHIVADAAAVAAFSSRPEHDAGRTPKLATHDLAIGALEPQADSSPGNPEAPCLVLYTSGTTGAPKGALLCARNIAATLDGLQRAWQLSERDTITHALPLFHAHGLVFGLFGALRVGACLEFLPRFSPDAVARALSGPRHVLYAVPTMYHRLCEAAETDPTIGAALGNARLLVSGSAALPAREHARIEALSGQRVCERYGLSETLINTAVHCDRPRRAGYVGEPLPGVEIKLVDDQREPIDRPAPLARPRARPDESDFGEIAVRGPNVFLGYLNRPEATAQVLDQEGWFYTGDLGAFGPDGYLRIVGRKGTDLIKTGGFKVGAGEIEAALLEHPGVREVAVLGLPDPDLGERIVAFVVARGDLPPDSEELIELVSKALSKHKRPREVRFVSELPRNAMGKVQKSMLKNGTP